MHSASDVQHLTDWSALAESCHWWWPHEGLIVASERPLSISRDGELLHNESGPAVEYRDGWKHWSLSGVTVDEQIVMSPEAQTVEQINGETNEEVRRFRVERFGVMRYLTESNAKVIDERRNDIEATYEILAETEHGQRLVTHCPSTGRRYFLGLPDRVETCEQAQRVLAGNIPMNVLGRT